MSLYSGKYDIYDNFFMHLHDEKEESIKDVLDKTKVYIWKNHDRHRLDLREERDVALYFPYTAALSNYYNGYSTILISESDYIRHSELEWIDFCVKQAKKEKARCKRNKIEYDVDNTYERRFSYLLRDEDEGQIKEIIRRVGEGGRVYTDDIRLFRYDFFRTKWFDDLVKIYGYDKDFAREWVWFTKDRQHRYLKQEY